jgi:hypothetical protein
MCISRTVVWVVLFFLPFSLGCGDDLELGTNTKESSLRIGRGESSLRFGVQSSGGLSGTRPIEDATVLGNIFNLRPPTFRPIIVFVFVDLRDPGTFQDFRDAEVGLVEDDRTFRVSHLAAGSLTVVFLLDQAGTNQDGTIDPGDQIAIFQDPGGQLKNLSATSEVILSDVDVTFTPEAPENGIATVQSEANIFVTQKKLPSPSSLDPPPTSSTSTPQ